jgi:hypothetical protein
MKKWGFEKTTDSAQGLLPEGTRLGLEGKPKLGVEGKPRILEEAHTGYVKNQPLEFYTGACAIDTKTA